MSKEKPLFSSFFLKKAACFQIIYNYVWLVFQERMLSVMLAQE